MNRAIALVQMHQVAVLVAQDLHFDVLGLADEFFDEYIRNTESCVGLAPRLIKCGIERVGRFHHAHSPPAASHRGLDDHRVAE